MGDPEFSRIKWRGIFVVFSRWMEAHDSAGEGHGHGRYHSRVVASDAPSTPIAQYDVIRACTLAVPVSVPKVSVTVTGFLMPGNVTGEAAALKEYVLLPRAFRAFGSLRDEPFGTVGSLRDEPFGTVRNRSGNRSGRTALTPGEQSLSEATSSAEWLDFRALSLLVQRTISPSVG